jgi:hypothetical protein
MLLLIGLAAFAVLYAAWQALHALQSWLAGSDNTKWPTDAAFLLLMAAAWLCVGGSRVLAPGYSHEVSWLWVPWYSFAVAGTVAAFRLAFAAIAVMGRKLAMAARRA